MFTALGVYLALDVILSLAILWVARKRLPVIRERLRAFLQVPESCSHPCADNDYIVRRGIYEELTGEEYDGDEDSN